ncbi:hypothetical protein KGM_214855 [Danaus plexippus plexippus]|uniref:Uncharacterized protein n=1 Tax=Danaus plexippus plexippus TaxID=278856 RepID=A0A212EK72_DANPL|nr:hypothetical protein KGM_214855 [Danaus plexippus plexippus]
MAKKRGKKINIKKAVVVKQSPVTESTTSEVIAASLVHQSVFLKVCRLCEAKDGPFLNIFEADKLTAKKIDAVMPFRIMENDDLPHKICFRCSAKLEELYEFIQKCIRTQDRLQNVLGKKMTFTKVKHRELWEEKLNKSNISNDDICDALIKKAMEGIKDIPLNPKPLEQNENCLLKRTISKLSTGIKNDKKNTSSNKKETNLKSEDSATSDNITCCGEPSQDETPVTRSLRSCNETNHNDSEKIAQTTDIKVKVKNSATDTNSGDKKTKEKEVPQTNTFSLNDATPQPEPTFNIMEHVSMIKVNGVGVLFQCKLCNRNFLKKQVVMSHTCAKNGAAKVVGPKPIIPAEPPKISTVKYINTKTNEVKKTEEEIKTENKTSGLDDDDKPVVKKPRPKIGPASKVRRYNEDNTPPPDDKKPATSDALQTVTPSTTPPVVQIPSFPSPNSRYKLMAGPNNTFTLVEDKNNPTKGDKPAQPVHAENRPYPVKLFKTLAHNSESEPVPFTTPAMKKQSYKIVQTGNPSKLLISTKSQRIEEIPKKRLRKPKNADDESQKQPFSVTLEDITPAKDTGFFTFVNVDPLLQPSYVLPTDNIIQESQISTSTNVAKQNIMKDTESKYSCNMCNEVFSREKKLLAHIHSHYNKMDEEDEIRAEKPGRKRRK